MIFFKLWQCLKFGHCADFFFSLSHFMLFLYVIQRIIICWLYFSCLPFLMTQVLHLPQRPQLT